jgi:hypothetical protein
VNAEQASKHSMWEPTQQKDGEGRRHRFHQGSDTNPSCGPTGVMATACLYMEIGRNTGNLWRWETGLPTGRPRGTGRAVGGVGEAHSTGETG